LYKCADNLQKSISNYSIKTTVTILLLMFVVQFFDFEIELCGAYNFTSKFLNEKLTKEQRS
jgi:hypothetical protein